jgi:ABC-type transport system involved in multi-copper enzyme maturation permease subunit
MRAILVIARRELDNYFATPLGWLALCGFVLLTGFFFTFALYEFNNYAMEAAFSPYGGDQVTVNDWLIPAIFGNWAIILLLASPALSMRIFAEDVGQHSFELLLSSPISAAEIVIGKYLGVVGFLAVLFATTLYQVAILYWLGSPDPGVLTASYLSMFLLAATCVAVGMYASAFTTNQIVAFIVSFAALLILYLLGWVGTVVDEGFWHWLGKASMLGHLEQLGKGLLHVKDVVYFVLFIGFFLFATQQRISSFRWSVGLLGKSRTLSDALWDAAAGLGALFVASKVIRILAQGTDGITEGVTNLVWLSFAVLGLLAIIGWGWRNREQLEIGLAERGARLSGTSLLLVLTALGIACAGYAVSERYDQRFDMTGSQRFTLSEQTLKLVDGLDADVQILGFFALGTPEESAFRDLIEGYETQSGHISVDIHDPQSKPMLTRQYEITSAYGTVVMLSGDEKQRLDSKFDEEAITNALVRLTSGTEHVVCFTTGHDELDPDEDVDTSGLGLAVLKLEGQNYAVRKVGLAREGRVPADCEVVVVANPRVDLLPGEREMVAGYVAGGGAVVVLFKPMDAPATAADLTRYGITVGDDIVVEQNPKYTVAGGDPTYLFLDQESFDFHPITNDLTSGVLMRAARSIKSGPPVPGIDVQEIARTTEYGWGETDMVTMPISFDEHTDFPGPVPLIVVAEVTDPTAITIGATALGAPTGLLGSEEAGAEPADADTPDGSPPEVTPPAGSEAAPPPSAAPDLARAAGGKVVVFGDIEFASNMLLDQVGNQDLFLNTIAWVVGEEDQLSIRPNEAAKGSISFDALQFLLIALLSLLLVPGLAVVGAIGTWRRRQS